MDKELTNCEGHTVSARAINTILKDMQWNRSPKQTSTFMVSLYSTRCQETMHWGKNSFSVNGAGTTGYPMKKNEVGPLHHNLYKSYLKWITNLNVRAQSTKHLEENININLHEP